jgi:hypothetical protein
MGVIHKELDLFPNQSGGEGTSRQHTRKSCRYVRKPVWMRSNALTSASMSSQVL